MLKAVIFDLDNTLLWDERSVDEAFAATCQYAQKKSNIAPERLEQVVREEALKLYASYPTYEFTKMIGINPIEGLWGTFSGSEQKEFRILEKIAPQYRKDAWTNALLSLGVDNPSFGEELGELFQSERRSRPYVYKDTFDVLDTLNGQFKLLLLTNGSPDLQQEKLAGVPSLAPYFDDIVISGDFGKGKPDPAIFEYCLNLLAIDNNEAVMVGDNLSTDILGAARTGIQSVWINHSKMEKIHKVVANFEILELKELLPIIKNFATEE